MKYRLKAFLFACSTTEEEGLVQLLTVLSMTFLPFSNGFFFAGKQIYIWDDPIRYEDILISCMSIHLYFYNALVHVPQHVHLLKTLGKIYNTMQSSVFLKIEIPSPLSSWLTIRHMRFFQWDERIICFQRIRSRPASQLESILSSVGNVIVNLSSCHLRINVQEIRKFFSCVVCHSNKVHIDISHLCLCICAVYSVDLSMLCFM